MKKIAYLGGVLLLVVIAAWITQTSFAAEEEKAESEQHGFIGAKSCKACHSKAAKGEQYVKWEASPHAHAYQTLQTDESKAICKEMGIETAPEATDRCLKCHVTAHGVAPELLGKKYDVAEGVGCESCHGPAADWKVTHMKDVETAMTQGMIHPTEELCLGCHNEESPTYKAWDREKKMATIAHPNPEKAAAEGS